MGDTLSRAYRYALLLTNSQEQAVQRQEKQLRYAWNKMVNWHRCALRDWDNGRQTQLLDEYQEILLKKNANAGRASPKAVRNGLFKQQAKKLAKKQKITVEQAEAILVEQGFEPVIPSRSGQVAAKMYKLQHGDDQLASRSAKKLAKKEGILLNEARERLKQQGYGTNGTGTGPRRLSVELAQERLMARAKYFYSGQRGPLYGLVQKFQKSCENWLTLSGTAQAPLYKRPQDKVALQRQVTSSMSCPFGPECFKPGWQKSRAVETDMSALIGQEGTHCTTVWHRPLPDEASVVQLAIAGRAGRRFLVVFLVCPRESVLKPFAKSTACVGIDTGYACALTAVSNRYQVNRQERRKLLAADIYFSQKLSADPQSKDVKALAGAVTGLERYAFNSGCDGILELQPPLARDAQFQKRLRRLQRKLERQKRAANPDCLNQNGTWKKGKRAKHLTNKMVETHQKIQKMYERQVNVRHDYYHVVAYKLAEQHGHIKLADWRPPQTSKGPTPLPKGQAKKRRNFNRKGLDHAICSFASILQDKANLSASPRTVEVIHEAYTTQTCGCCRALTGPKEPTTKVAWTCSSCGAENHRKANAAENIRTLSTT